jgi:hypothetical protein
LETRLIRGAKKRGPYGEPVSLLKVNRHYRLLAVHYKGKRNPTFTIPPEFCKHFGIVEVDRDADPDFV